MKQFTFILSLLFNCLISFGQNDPTKYFFSEIGMTIYVPKGFKLQDSKPAPEYLGAGLKPITDPAVIKQMTKDDPKTLLEVESSDKQNIMEIRLIPITETLTQLMGDSIQYIETCQKMTIAAARQASEQFDTVSSIIKIDNLIFDKMFTISNIRGHKYHEGGYITKIGNYYLGIHMFFEEGEKGKRLKNIIETAKFH